MRKLFITAFGAEDDSKTPSPKLQRLIFFCFSKSVSKITVTGELSQSVPPGSETLDVSVSIQVRPKFTSGR